MKFASDNTAGISQPILAALSAANQGNVPSYGADDLTAAVEDRLSEIFERKVTAFLVTTGTAANALSLSAITPPWGAILCHERSHAMTDECGAPEFYTGGAKMIGLGGTGAKISLDEVRALLEGWEFGVQHHVQPSAVTISQASEFGLVWRPAELADLSAIARRHGLKLHMDGARFANALVSLNASPAELTWRAGVDIMSFGATKNGAMCAEAVVVFSEKLAEAMAYRRKRAGHLISKSRFIAAQLLAYLEGGHWLDLARHANAMAARLAEAVQAAPAARLAIEVEANEVFVLVETSAIEQLKRAGAVFYEWAGKLPVEGLVPASGERLVRLVTSFATSEEEVDRFSEILRGR